LKLGAEESPKSAERTFIWVGLIHSAHVESKRENLKLKMI